MVLYISAKPEVERVACHEIAACLLSDISEDLPTIDELPHGFKLKSILQASFEAHYSLPHQLRLRNDEERLPADDEHPPSLKNAAFFPWHKQSLHTLWGGKRITTWPLNRPRTKVPRGTLPFDEEPMGAEEVWLRIIRKWMGCVAICAGDELRLVQTRDNVLSTIRHLKTIPVKSGLDSDEEEKKKKRSGSKRKGGPKYEEIPQREELRTVTWALDFDTLHPLVVFAGDQAIIRIVDVENWERVGAVTGHGGPITHLTTHPIRPNYILSTSQDWTARMWSLADPVDTPAAPAYWPGQLSIASQHVQAAKKNEKKAKGGKGGRGASLTNVADLDMSRLTLEDAFAQTSATPSDALVSRTGPAGSVPERGVAGHGKGVCIAVFKGAAAGLGGHQSWVLCAADRAVKIWRIPDFPTPDTQPLVGVNFSTIELPLFSSTHLHEGAIEYIRWCVPIHFDITGSN
ncbi:hypothetical protein FRC07_000445 [Ceratobasidium sp. 392]|nr:hypothetical protein FRC07_000445 [Ceratobasidium sp. 392]